MKAFHVDNYPRGLLNVESTSLLWVWESSSRGPKFLGSCINAANLKEGMGSWLQPATAPALAAIWSEAAYLSLCFSSYIYIYMYTKLYIYEYCIYICMHVHAYIYACFTYVYMHIVYVYMCVSMYLWSYDIIHMHVSVSSLNSTEENSIMICCSKDHFWSSLFEMLYFSSVSFPCSLSFR